MELFQPVKFLVLLVKVRVKEYAFMLSMNTFLWLANKIYSLYHSSKQPTYQPTNQVCKINP